MQTKIEKPTKTVYLPPRIERIKLDNEISLILESDPPSFEGSNRLNAPEYSHTDPFKTNLG